VIATCATAQLCDTTLGGGGVVTACVEAACSQGELKCSGSMLLQCNDGQTKYESVADCLTEPLCLKSKDTLKPACLPPLCGAGGKQPAGKCEGGDVKSCDASQQAYDTMDCSDTQRCNPTTRQCVSFSIDETEVTRQAYAAFSETTPSSSVPGCKWNTSYKADTACTQMGKACADGTGAANCDTYPQTCVDWCDAHDYCASLGKHLCGRMGTGGMMVPVPSATDAGQSEWMNACSAGGQYAWVVGDALESVPCNDANYWSQASQPLPVKERSACVSPVKAYQGAWDLSGNVAEWENSCDQAPDITDEDGLVGCLVRGGAYNSSDDAIRCKTSEKLSRNSARNDVGFRCCGP
jgi:formylglycine-generating enzyme